MRARIDGAGLRRRDRSPATSPSTRGCRNCRSGTQSGAGRLPTTPLFIAVLVWMVFAGASVARAVSPASSPGQLERVPLHGLCVTNGVISTLSDGRLAIDSPSSRAVARNIGYQSAEIRFRYLGPTQSSKPLASGELRRQIGIKLDAQDTCNLLYIMWHIEPDSRIAVSVKSNPGQHTHAQCHANGYTTIRPSGSLAVPRIRPGEAHTLRAELNGSELVVIAAGRPAWVGTVGGGLARIVGPVGLRTDNGRFEFEY